MGRISGESDIVLPRVETGRIVALDRTSVRAVFGTEFIGRVRLERIDEGLILRCIVRQRVPSTR